MHRSRITKFLDNDGTPARGLAKARFKITSSLEERLYATTDANHNVTSIDDVFGAVKERLVYDPYRESTVLSAAWASTGDTLAWSTRSQGEREDATTNTIDGRNRLYGIGMGRWMQADSEGYIDGANRYQFVRGEPIATTDPTGNDARLYPDNQIIYNMSKSATITYEGDWIEIEDKKLDLAGKPTGKVKTYKPTTEKDKAWIVSQLTEHGLNATPGSITDSLLEPEQHFTVFDMPGSAAHYYSNLKAGKNSWKERLRGRSNIVDADFIVAIPAGYTLLDPSGTPVTVGVIEKGTGNRYKLPFLANDVIDCPGRPKTLQIRQHVAPATAPTTKPSSGSTTQPSPPTAKRPPVTAGIPGGEYLDLRGSLPNWNHE